MFGPAGHVYVFFVYGMHWNFNMVTGREGEPHAVLIRAVEPVAGVELMASRRAMAAQSLALTNGPGKVCQAFAITREHYGWDLCASPLFLAAAPASAQRVRVARAPRVGIGYAGEWAKKPWRFFEHENPYVSRRPRARKNAR
jgi:DNA-3-methyladenine glycosylase